MANKEEKILFKESALIECDWTGLSLTQRKVYNALLFFAKQQYFYKDKEYWEQNGDEGADKKYNFKNYSNLRDNKFKIAIKDIVELSGQRELNENDLMKSIDELHRKHVNVNLLKKDKSGHWNETERMFYLIPDIEISATRTEIIYELPSLIFDIISQNQESDRNVTFAKIDMHVQKSFKSKFSLILYEIIQDYINAPQFPSIDISTLKKMLGVADKYNNNFRAFNRNITPAVNEINDKIKDKITYKIVKDGRRAIAIEFTKIAKQERVEEREQVKSASSVSQGRMETSDDNYTPLSDIYAEYLSLRHFKKNK